MDINRIAVLVPVIALEMILMITALVHVLRHKDYKRGNRILWIFVVVFFQFFGPVLYFVLGRSEE